MRHLPARRGFLVFLVFLVLALSTVLAACGSISVLPDAAAVSAADGGAGGAAPSTADGGGGAQGGADARADVTSTDVPGDRPGDDVGQGAARDAAGDVTTEAPSPSCDLSQPFGTPALVPGLPVDTRAAIVARFSPDELTAYFSRADPAQACCDYQIQVATRSARGQPFGAATPLDTVNSPAIDLAPSVTGDGLALYLASDRDTSLGAYKLYSAMRARAGDPFGVPAQVPMVGDTTASIDSSPYLLPAGDVLYFGSSRSGNGDLYRGERNSAGFLSAAPVSVNGPLFEGTPVLTPDELTLYFTSDRTGGAQGGFDVWTATRTDRSAPFGPIANLTAVNTASDERPTFVSADGCRLYLTRAVGSQNTVMVAERSR